MFEFRGFMVNTASILEDTKAALYGLWQLSAVTAGAMLLSCVVPTANAESVKKDYYCCIVDRSGSIAVNGLTQKVIDGVVKHISPQLTADVEFEVVLFDTETERPKRWRAMDSAAVTEFEEYFKKNYTPRSGIKNGKTVGYGYTRLYDTVYEALERLRPRVAEYGNVGVLIISDGNDEGENNGRGSKKNKDWSAVKALADDLLARNPECQFRMDALGFKPDPWPPPPFTGCSFGIQDDWIPELIPPPKAEFECLPAEALTGQKVAFRLLSMKNVKDAFWKFGDGANASGIRQEHAYSAEGQKAVTVVVSGRGGQFVTNTVKDAVAVKRVVPLEARFKVTPHEARMGDTVVFSDESLGAPDGWSWEIAGKGTVAERNPAVVFDKAGEVSVALTVSKEGVAAAPVRKTVRILPPVPLKASFIVGKEARVGESVRPVDTSEGAPAKWRWEVTGKKASGARYPEFVFDTPGEVSVTLTVTHGDGRTDTARQTFTVLPPPPDASFTISPERLVVGKAATLAAVASKPGEEHSWLADGLPLGSGAGLAKTGWTPQKKGPVKLTHSVSASGGKDSRDMQVEVQEAIHADFGIMTAVNLCLSGNEIVFADKSGGEIVKRHWNFGDGQAGDEPKHSYETDHAITFSVILTVSGPDGTSSATNMLTIRPKPPASADFTVSAVRVQFGGSVKVEAADTGASVKHVWLDNGQEIVDASGKVAFDWKPTGIGEKTLKHRVSNAGGEKTQERKLVVEAKISPAFKASPKKGQIPLRGKPFTVKMTDLTQPPGAYGYQWDFGDGTTSKERDPEHDYTSVTVFTVRLTVKDTATGLEWNAPDVRVSVLPNTQIHDWLIWQAVFICGAFVVVVIWAFIFRQPWPKRNYALGKAGLHGPSLTIGAALLAAKAKHDISLPFREHFVQNFARLENTDASEGWTLFAEPAAEYNLTVNGSAVNPDDDSGVVLKNGDDIFFGEWNYRYELRADCDAFLIRNSNAPIVVRLFGGVALVLFALIPSFYLVFQLFN